MQSHNTKYEQERILGTLLKKNQYEIIIVHVTNGTGIRRQHILPYVRANL